MKLKLVTLIVLLFIFCVISVLLNEYSENKKVDKVGDISKEEDVTAITTFPIDIITKEVGADESPITAPEIHISATTNANLESISNEKEENYKQRDELNIIRDSIYSEYAYYDTETLHKLTTQGDLLAFNFYIQKLAFRDKLDIDKIAELAKSLKESRKPQAYLLMADLISSTTENKILAMAYVYSAFDGGSEMAKLMLEDYQSMYALTEIELAQAKDIASNM